MSSWRQQTSAAALLQTVHSFSLSSHGGQSSVLSPGCQTGHRHVRCLPVSGHEPPGMLFQRFSHRTLTCEYLLTLSVSLCLSLWGRELCSHTPQDGVFPLLLLSFDILSNIVLIIPHRYHETLALKGVSHSDLPTRFEDNVGEILHFYFVGVCCRKYSHMSVKSLSVGSFNKTFILVFVNSLLSQHCGDIKLTPRPKESEWNNDNREHHEDNG